MENKEQLVEGLILLLERFTKENLVGKKEIFLSGNEKNYLIELTVANKNGK